MTADSVEQVRAIASDIFNMFAQDESGGAPPECIDEWDSIQRLNLVLALEEHFGVEFAPEEIDAMKTLSDFASVVREKHAQNPAEILNADLFGEHA